MKKTASGVVALAVVAVIALIIFFAKFARIDSSASSVKADAPKWPEATRFESLDWSIFQVGKAGGSAAQPGDLSSRFRLAGTFFWSATASDDDIVRKAIIDSLEEQDEHIAAEGDVIDGVTVVSIYENSVILRDGRIEEELTLIYSARSISTAQDPNAGKWLNLAADEEAISTNQFGYQVGDARWVMSRDRLEDYALDIEDHPARMVPLFDSMMPVWQTDDNGTRRVDGYRLEIQGEQDFYSAVGLQEGDEVMKVNGMPMTNKRRAMFWINQFREGKLNTFMLDIVRDGKPQRLTYLMR